MDALDINRRLILLYGRDTTYDKPNWRVVWTDELVEKREGEWEDFTPAGIYLGTKKGIREVKKYDYLKPCWMLEKLHHAMIRGVHDEVKEPYTYEPIYPFLDKDDNNLPLNWKVVEIIVHAWTYGERQFMDHKAEEQKRYDAEVAKARDLIEQDDPKEQPTFKSSVYVGETNESKH